MLNRILHYVTFRNLIFFFSLIAGWPCVFYLMGWLPGYQINYILLMLIASAFVIPTTNRQLPMQIQLLFCIQIISWGCYAFAYVDTSYYTRILILMITYCLLLMQQSDRDHLGFIKIYDGWLTLQIVLGSIGIMLVLVGILEPIFKFVEGDGRPGYFFGLFTTNTYQKAFGLVRNAGFFDEPGALAFWGIFALIYNKLYLKKSKLEVVLIIGLISTASLAYFIQLGMYLYVFYKDKGWKLWAIIGFLAILVWYLSSFTEGMNDALAGRLEYDTEKGTISGDNRSELMERCWNIFMENPFFGVGAETLTTPQYFARYGFLGANFFSTFAADGLIGGFISYLPFLYLILAGDRKIFGIGIILLLGYLQRPYDGTQLLYPLTLYTLIFTRFRERQSQTFPLYRRY